MLIMLPKTCSIRFLCAVFPKIGRKLSLQTFLKFFYFQARLPGPSDRTIAFLLPEDPFFGAKTASWGRWISLVIVSLRPFPKQFPTMMLPSKWLANISLLSINDLRVGSTVSHLTTHGPQNQL